MLFWTLGGNIPWVLRKMLFYKAVNKRDSGNMEIRMNSILLLKDMNINCLRSFVFQFSCFLRSILNQQVKDSEGGGERCLQHILRLWLSNWWMTALPYNWEWGKRTVFAEERYWTLVGQPVEESCEICTRPVDLSLEIVGIKPEDIILSQVRELNPWVFMRSSKKRAQWERAWAGPQEEIEQRLGRNVRSKEH